MRPVIVLWVSAGGNAAFEAAVPLEMVGLRNRQLGFSNAIDIVFAEGFAHLSEAYKVGLRDLGFALHDAEKIFRPYAERFATLDHFGVFLKNCFLRWLVVAELFRGESILHFDGDVMFNECPTVLARLFAGRTILLQGCPALTAISDPRWFQQYEAELTAYARDIDGYSAQAWRERAGWERTFHTKWAGHWVGPKIASDQDLLSHLVHADRLVQSDPAEFVRSAPEHVFFENPLIIGDLVPERPLVYRRTAGIDYFGSRRVALWHMQTDWCRYLAKHLLRERIGPLGGTGRLSFRQRDRETLVGDVLRKLTGNRIFPRPAVYQRFFEDGDFREVFSDRRWWQPGVFPAS